MVLVRQNNDLFWSHGHFTPSQIAVFASFCPRSVSPLARSYTLALCQTSLFSALLHSFCCHPPILGPHFSVPLSFFIFVVFFGGVFSSLLGAPSSEHLECSKVIQTALTPKLSRPNSQPPNSHSQTLTFEISPLNSHPPNFHPLTPPNSLPQTLSPKPSTPNSHPQRLTP